MELKLLKDYINETKNIPDAYEHNYQLQDLLSSVYISEAETSVDLEFINQGWSHSELIKACKKHISIHGLNNNLFSENEKYGSIHTNFNDTLLNTTEWGFVRLILGNIGFGHLIMNHHGFYHKDGTFNQLFGMKIFSKFSGKNSRVVTFNLNRALYRDLHHLKFLDPVPSTKIAFLKEVFKEEFSKDRVSNKTTKRLSQISKILPKVIENHKKLKYRQIFDGICQEKSGITDNLNYAIEKKSIMKFVTVAFEKLFPIELYGSSHNKSIIFAKFAELVMNDKDHFINLEMCLSGLRLKDICWLGKSYEGNLNKQDFLKRKLLLEQFIQWLFQEFLIKLLSSLFHITHISSSKELLFFKHSRWRKITAPFIESYISEFLIKQDSISISQTDAMAKKIQSNFKIMPKKNNDFRVINKPMKGTLEKDVQEYTNMVQKEIRPAKRVLNQIRLSRLSNFKKITSADQIPLNIMKFKQKILVNNNNLPVLYFLKFDVRACYDNIPRSKVEENICELISQDYVYYYTTTKTMDLRTLSTRQTRALQTAESLTRFPKKKYQLLDMANTQVDSLLGSDILAITRSQLNNSTTRIRGRVYRRQKGIFQGFHLSSLFCDIVYDKMIDEVFGFLNDDQSLILRLADDFLVISTDSESIALTKSILNQGMEKYGVEINKLKTVINLGDSAECFTYCGYEIEPINLTVLKDFQDTPVLTSYIRSHRLVVDKLLGIYKLRLSYNTLDLKLNTLEVVQRQIESLVRNIAKNYISLNKKLVISVTGFERLISEMISVTVPKLGVNWDTNIVNLVADTINGAFLRELMVKNTNFQQCIDFILKN